MTSAMGTNAAPASVGEKPSTFCRPDADRYFDFGIDLVIGAAQNMAAGRPVAS